MSKCTAPTLNVSADTYNHLSGNTYDAAGQVTNDGFRSYTWDAEGRMTLAGSTTYTYDGDGQRVKKSTGTLYWDDLAETDTGGNTTNEYVFFGGTGIARRDASGNVYYYFANHLGSPTITNATGAICYDADFYPFGGELTFTNTCSQSFKFAGIERDSETGLDHTQYRQYASNLGRWLSPDLLAGDLTDPQSLNRYTYVINNPVNSIDPLGLAECNPQGVGNGCPGSGSNPGAPSVECKLDGIEVDCSQLMNQLDTGAAALCPSGVDCGLVRATVGANGSTVYQYQVWVSGSSSQSGGVISISTGYWETETVHANVKGGPLLILPGIAGSAEEAALEGPALARYLGQAGEEAAGIVKNTERIESATGGAGYRVPDILDKFNKLIGEVKNTKYLSLTKQLQDYIAYAQEHGYAFKLVTNAKLSVPLQDALKTIGAIVEPLVK